MAMTVPGMKAAILAKLNSELGAAQDDTKRQSFANAIADAVVTYIQTNAAVPLGIAVSTTGTAAAQTGATTAPGTVA